MNSQSRLLASVLIAACAVLCARPLSAKGSIGFLTTTTTVDAGEPESYMELGRDWFSPYDTAMAMAGHKYALPKEPQSVNIQSSRTATHLLLKLSIEDQTRRQRDDAGMDLGLTLGIGDKIIIQIDPNNSGHAAVPDPDLDTGAAAIDKDHRFEITIKDNLIDSTKKREPLTGSVWKVPVAFPGLATLTLTATQYVVDVSIPLADIGNPTADIGIAIAVINDLGHGHMSGMTQVWDVTGTALPASMPLVAGSDPGLVDAAQGSGVWVNPSTWATGYFSTVAGTVNLSHTPSYYWSNSIRISRCDVSQFSDVQESTVGMNQLTLTGWYVYNPDKPCQMKVWVRANVSGGVVQKRLLVVWGRPGIAPKEWYFVDLTAPIAFSSPEEIVSILSSVPAVAFSDHPCLRVYVLPAVLTSPWAETDIQGIDTQAELSAMEAHYLITPAGDFQNAQMNFTARSTGSCTVPACALALPPAGADQIAAVLASLLPIPAAPPLQLAQHDPGGRDREGRDGDEPGGLVRIMAEGVGFAKPEAGTPYTYLTTVGGIGWAFPNNQIDPQKGLQLPVEVTNPAVLFRDFSVQPPQDVPSPPREIFVVVTAEAAPGVPVPNVEVVQPGRLLQAGESTKTTLTVTSTGVGTEAEDGDKRFGLSLHAGINEPHGDFADGADGDKSWMVDFEYRLSPRFSLELLYGHHDFDGVEAFPDTEIDQVSLNGKLFFPGFWRPFVNAGMGSYDVSPGSSDTGANVGFGILRMFPTGLGVELGYNFHRVFASPDLDFSTLLAGLRWRF